MEPYRPAEMVKLEGVELLVQYDHGSSLSLVTSEAIARMGLTGRGELCRMEIQDGLTGTTVVSRASHVGRLGGRLRAGHSYVE